MGYDESRYIFLRGNDKRSLPGGPEAGWSLMIRREDGCLLVVATVRSGRGHLTITEESVEESGRFERDADDVRRQLVRRYGLGGQEVETLVANMDRCLLGYRVLVDEVADRGG